MSKSVNISGGFTRFYFVPLPTNYKITGNLNEKCKKFALSLSDA